MKKEYNKLVRDEIPEIIKASGAVPTTHIASDDEYRSSLLTKLGEEAAEFIEEPNQEEAADILEVLNAMCNLIGWNMEDIERLRQKKAEKRGGFKKRIILDSVKE